MRQINYHLVDLMSKRGLSQRMLAKKTGLSKNMIKNVANGTFKLKLRTAIAIQSAIPEFNAESEVRESYKNNTIHSYHNPTCKMIIELLICKDITQSELCRRSGVAKSCLTEILQAKKELSELNAKRIQSAYPEFDAEKALDVQRKFKQENQ